MAEGELKPICEICEEAESVPSRDDDLDMCALCRAQLDQAREDAFMREWLGIEPNRGPETIN